VLGSECGFECALDRAEFVGGGGCPGSAVGVECARSALVRSADAGREVGGVGRGRSGRADQCGVRGRQSDLTLVGVAGGREDESECGGDGPRDQWGMPADSDAREVTIWSFSGRLHEL
jgi:hypothetical protein